MLLGISLVLYRMIKTTEPFHSCDYHRLVDLPQYGNSRSWNGSPRKHPITSDNFFRGAINRPNFNTKPVFTPLRDKNTHHTSQAA